MLCLVFQYQKGGAREAEAGNHPRGEGGEAEGREQTKSGRHLCVTVAYLEEEEAVSVTQKRCRAEGISALTQADNVPKCCPVPLSDRCHVPKPVVWERGARQLFFVSQWYKTWTKSSMISIE